MHKKTQALSVIPTTPADMSNVWKLGALILEMWSSAFSTISSRTGLWATKSPTDPKMMHENQRMVTEKLDASWEVAVEMQKSWLNMLTGSQTPWWTSGRRIMTPLHKRTTANARRLP